MDLQWFAAEDEGRTFEPTEVTYRKAREEGRVAKSQELIAALGLLLPALTIIFLAPLMLRTCVEMLRFFFTRVNELDPLKDRLTAGLFISYFVRLVWPILTVAMVTALFSNLIQVGFLFTTKPLTPDFTKILPRFGRYFQRTLFSVEGLFNFFKSIVKMAIIGIVAYMIIKSRYKELANLQTAGLWAGVTLVASLTRQMLIIVALLLLALSIPDYLFQRWQFRQSLKMTREAAKEEIKQDEGDQEMRRRLRNRYREMLSRNMLNAVPSADVVITNPTHYSVALEYDSGKMDAPTVVAKGEDDLALRIREVAKENGVPVVPHPPLTRTLYNETEVGDQIPIRYWNVVALVVGKFFSFEQKQAKARRNANAAGANAAGANAAGDNVGSDNAGARMGA
ncbi:MAG: flagellar biosynthesis protein FlhB [Treponema sp.]|nr:flagellar biosynthesis protein FlhB [Treponema sp.]